MSVTLPPNPIVPISRLLTDRHDRCFELRQPRIRIHIVERSEQLLLGVRVAGRAIAADADADRAGRAALPLRVPHGVKNRLLHAVERPVGAAEMRQLDRQRVLGIGVLAAAALENQLDLDLVLLPLLEVDDRRARSEIVAGVLAGDRIDRIGAQLAALASLRPRPRESAAASRSDSRRPASSPRRSACRCPGRWRLP